MDITSYKTATVNKKTAEKKWLLVDAEGQPLGRLSSKIAKILRGKHKPNFTPFSDCGDNVVVINADKVTLSGNKWEDKEYVRYTGYPGGQRINRATMLHSKDPNQLIEYAVKGMLPKNKLGAELFRNLKVFSGGEHSHDAQQPTPINITEFN